MTRDLATAPLIDTAAAPADWLAEAWRRMRTGRPERFGMTIAQAQAHDSIGPTLRAFAAQLARDAEQAARERERQLRYGRKVNRGYVRVAGARRGA